MGFYILLKYGQIEVPAGGAGPPVHKAESQFVPMKPMLLKRDASPETNAILLARGLGLNKFRTEAFNRQTGGVIDRVTRDKYKEITDMVVRSIFFAPYDAAAQFGYGNKLTLGRTVGRNRKVISNSTPEGVMFNWQLNSLGQMLSALFDGFIAKSRWMAGKAVTGTVGGGHFDIALGWTFI